MHCQISARRTCNPCGYTMKMSSMYHRLLIYNVKRSTKIKGMGPFKPLYQIYRFSNNNNNYNNNNNNNNNN